MAETIPFFQVVLTQSGIPHTGEKQDPRLWIKGRTPVRGNKSAKLAPGLLRLAAILEKWELKGGLVFKAMGVR